MRSAKLDQNLRAGVETRPYNGAPSADPYKRARGDPLACHSEPIGEESRFVYFYFALLEILRFAQDDKLYFVRVGNGLDRSVKLYQITRANTVRPYE